MRLAYRLVVYLNTCALLFGINLNYAQAAESGLPTEGKFTAQIAFDNPVDFALTANLDRYSARLFAGYSNEIELTLYDAVTSKLGRPYRSQGVDNRGYDCSGFVWRVFQDAGIDFERGPARALWQNLPAANEKESEQFGTLVFFKGLNHVGIVRDAYSFYHASSSQGIVRSYYSDYSDYWGSRVIGFRRPVAATATEKGKDRPRN